MRSAGVAAFTRKTRRVEPTAAAPYAANGQRSRTGTCRVSGVDLRRCWPNVESECIPDGLDSRPTPG